MLAGYNPKTKGIATMKKIDEKLEQTDPRSRRTWRFTTADIAKATGYSAGKVRDDIYRRILDPRCLVSLGQYVMVAVLLSRRLSDGKDWNPIRTVDLANSTCLDYSSSQNDVDYQSPLDKPVDPNFKW